MSLLLIGQIWLCLLATFTLGLLVGWLAKRLAASQKRTASLQNHGVVSHGREAASRERDITTIQLNDLRAQVEMATGALEKRETSLAKLETDLTERVAALSAVTVQNDQLQTRLRETETALQHNTQSAISLEAEVRTLRSELGTKD